MYAHRCAPKIPKQHEHLVQMPRMPQSEMLEDTHVIQSLAKVEQQWGASSASVMDWFCGLGPHKKSQDGSG